MSRDAPRDISSMRRSTCAEVSSEAISITPTKCETRRSSSVNAVDRSASLGSSETSKMSLIHETTSEWASRVFSTSVEAKVTSVVPLAVLHVHVEDFNNTT